MKLWNATCLEKVVLISLQLHLHGLDTHKFIERIYGSTSEVYEYSYYLLGYLLSLQVTKKSN